MIHGNISPLGRNIPKPTRRGQRLELAHGWADHGATAIDQDGVGATIENNERLTRHDEPSTYRGSIRASSQSAFTSSVGRWRQSLIVTMVVLASARFMAEASAALPPATAASLVKGRSVPSAGLREG